MKLHWNDTTPHHILSMLVPFFPSFLRLGITLACIWNFAKIYFHNYVSEFLKKIPFSRSVESWHAYPYIMSSSQNFLLRYAPDCTFQAKNENAPYRGSLGGHPLPHPPPARSLRSLGLGRFAPSQRIVPPQMFWLITPLVIGVYMRQFYFGVHAHSFFGPSRRLPESRIHAAPNPRLDGDVGSSNPHN